MDVHRVLKFHGISSGQDYGHGDIKATSLSDDDKVPAAQSLLGQAEAPQLVFLIRVGAGLLRGG
jgi:hypothetical protein